MPLGSGYSVEQQVIGKEDIGGIQMEISPVYNNQFKVSAQRIYNYLPMNTGNDYRSPPPAISWNNHDTPNMMGCTEGVKIFIKDYRHGDNTRGFPSQGIYYDLPVGVARDNSSMGSTFDSPFVRPATLRDLLDLSTRERSLQKPLCVVTITVLSIFVEQDGSLECAAAEYFRGAMFPVCDDMAVGTGLRESELKEVSLYEHGV
ncbi:hypothetical protein L873DRAFT_1794919 [Choiromyces venosus 120613-1]|uniref:Uncharacterized protein n=1 Tax=Choiromyces venosus 120613-1 TaxID=1336337 RepID=A0A3N4IZH6_9PEZI|nr:hypothetical protein L873DRAFT_1794919 [Choiromyces venosus 120613-1]